MSALSDLEPKPLWNFFTELNAVPRPSKKEERVIAFMEDFGKRLGLKTVRDKIGNVIISKPASQGMENRKTVVLQGHLDMVHQKNNDTDFDFETQGIKMRVEGDWVKAEGTTLGADNGIGVSGIMAILASDNIAHPPVEALFTIDEETGMTGAIGLEADMLHGEIMLNLDTEDDHELTIGCAGGVNFTAEGTFKQTKVTNLAWRKLIISGLTGGHSGMDIHLGRGNANKLMNRLLKKLMTEHNVGLASIEGGGLRNAIPRESTAIITAENSVLDKITQTVSEFKAALVEEYYKTDPNLKIKFEQTNAGEQIMDEVDARNWINAIYACQTGIYRMSPDIPGLVQTSNNLACIVIKEGKISVHCLARSAVESEKNDLVETLRSTFESVGAKIALSADYPGWTPKPEAEIVQLMTGIYRERFNAEPLVDACHAGLECGILGRNYPAMEMISFGPNITGAHSPDEKVQISSVQKFWGFLLVTLQNIPLKN